MDDEGVIRSALRPSTVRRATVRGLTNGRSARPRVVKIEKWLRYLNHHLGTFIVDRSFKSILMCTLAYLLPLAPSRWLHGKSRDFWEFLQSTLPREECALAAKRPTIHSHWCAGNEWIFNEDILRQPDVTNTMVLTSIYCPKLIKTTENITRVIEKLSPELMNHADVNMRWQFGVVTVVTFWHLSSAETVCCRGQLFVDSPLTDRMWSNLYRLLHVFIMLASNKIELSTQTFGMILNFYFDLF